MRFEVQSWSCLAVAYASGTASFQGNRSSQLKRGSASAPVEAVKPPAPVSLAPVSLDSEKCSRTSGALDPSASGKRDPKMTDPNPQDQRAIGIVAQMDEDPNIVPLLNGRSLCCSNLPSR